MQHKTDSKASATTKLAGEVAETPASKVVIQQQQIIVDELLARTVKLEERVIALEGGLASASHITPVLQEQLTANNR